MLRSRIPLVLAAVALAVSTSPVLSALTPAVAETGEVVAAADQREAAPAVASDESDDGSFPFNPWLPNGGRLCVPPGC